MSPSYWGPSTWIFMHTLAAKIKETSFPLIGPNLITFLIQICKIVDLLKNTYLVIIFFNRCIALSRKQTS